MYMYIHVYVMKSICSKNTKISECLYWRGYGCVYGDRCRYLHIKKNKGIDVKQRKPKNYKQQQ